MLRQREQRCIIERPPVAWKLGHPTDCAFRRGEDERSLEGVAEAFVFEHLPFHAFGEQDSG